MTEPRPAPAYLDPIRDELDRLRAENERLNRSIDRARMERAQAQDAETVACIALEEAEARVDQLTDLLDDRSAALNRTGASNDTMRATLTRIEKVIDAEMFWAGEPGGYAVDVSDLRAALAVPADQEAAK